ncbi:myroilysin precursor [Fusarium albosuccineum]|uniref:Myroilysin n=1 Tax=Fusarium albosuccineum TaxID=1237068 RepID=A0A8H4P0D5_9HYPO|nr:myroilysin precursor [Fusarium albosuccineum]
MKITSLLAAAFLGAQSVLADEYVYLVNSQRGNEYSSGMAYYGDGHPASQQPRPDDYTDVTHGSNVHWEGQPVKGTFGTGVSFTSNIFADAAGKGPNAWAGTGNNGFQKFNCYKGTSPGGKPWLLYTVDGWSVYVIYFCRNNG